MPVSSLLSRCTDMSTLSQRRSRSSTLCRPSSLQVIVPPIICPDRFSPCDRCVACMDDLLPLITLERSYGFYLVGWLWSVRRAHEIDTRTFKGCTASGVSASECERP